MAALQTVEEALEVLSASYRPPPDPEPSERIPAIASEWGSRSPFR